MSDQRTIRFHDMKNPCMKAALLLAIFTIVVAVPGMEIDARASASTRIGVLAHKGTDICSEMWQLTMDYLDKALPGRQFDLVPLQFREVESAVANKSIDFLFCNPSIYVDLEVRYGVTRIMTLRNLVGTQIVSEFGGVVFCRADRSDLQNLRDARGQRLAATKQISFGGWYMALREFRSAGIDPERDCVRLSFLGTHPAVVRAVLSGEADIGTVRTDTIERMAASGEIRMDEIRVIPGDAAPGSQSTFPYLHSTHLYPEWPFAKLSDTTDELSREVTVALLSMPADSPAAMAAQSGGWGVCLNYTSVHDCLRELRLPPYEHYGQMSWSDLWRQYWPWLVAITALIIALLGALLLLRGRQLAVMMISGQNRLLLESAGEGICGMDINGITTFVNPAANKILGYTTEELLGKNLHALTHHMKPDGRPYPNHECPGHMSCNNGTVHQGCDEFFYRKDGSSIPISYSSRPIVDMGRIRGAVICFQDITDRKQAEEKIHKLSHLLIQAQEKERHLISCELHDSIAQNLSVLKINFDMVYHDPSMISPALRKKLTASSSLLFQIIKDVRNLAYDLRLPGLEEMGLVKALEIYCEEVSENGGIKVDFQSPGMSVMDLDGNMGIHIYRLIQEGLNNVRKHAEADHATIILLGSSPNLILRIEDNGRGFDVKAQELLSASTKRMGICSMQERVNLLYGKMAIQSQPMKGTKIFIKIPL
ncbi:MAG: PhnD/SsuA/transferrin family substrate-binding protein [Deltaproteobacteria bacterium]|nr:PhnD/SsuA/transferrin family substrate-binding protein [Deltaproteobacteria bacterium]